MKSTFRDFKVLIIVFSVLYILIPTVIYLFELEDGFEIYEFTDLVVRTIWKAALFYLALEVYSELRLHLRIHTFIDLDALSLQLERRNAKKSTPLDRRDARILLVMAEAAILSGNDAYGEAVLDNVRARRRDLFQKDVRLRYLHARGEYALASVRGDFDGMERYVNEMLRCLKAMRSPFVLYYRFELSMFEAVVRLDDGSAKFDRLTAATVGAPTPLRQAQGIWELSRLARRMGQKSEVEFCVHRLRNFSGARSS
jgi:hypothetical protein